MWSQGETLTLIGRTLSVHRSHDGNDVYVNAETRVDNCAFDPGGSQEITQGGDQVTTRPLATLPPGAALPTAVDAVRREATGDVYEVDGQPATYINPFDGWNPGVVLHLKEVIG